MFFKLICVIKKYDTEIWQHNLCIKLLLFKTYDLKPTFTLVSRLKS